MLRRLLVSTLLCAAVSCSSAAASEPYGFIRTQTDQLAVPGYIAGAEITPEGHLYTGSAEMGLWYGEDLRSWNQPLRSRPDAQAALLRGVQRDRRVTYTADYYAAVLDERPSAVIDITIRNTGTRATQSALGIAFRYTGGRRQAPRGDAFYSYRFRRPVASDHPGLYTQPGVPFNSTWRYSLHDRIVQRDGALLAFIPHGGRHTPPSRRVLASQWAGRTEFRAEVSPGQTRQLRLVVPFEPVERAHANAFAHAAQITDTRAQMAATWREQLQGMMRARVPERKVTDTFNASVMQLFESRYRTAAGDWVQTVNKLQYHAFWLRDAAIISNALDLAGLNETAEQNIRFFARWQQPDGLFVSRQQQLDGVGQALWAIGEHARITADRQFAARWLPAVSRGAAWIAQATAADRYGLLPFADPKDGEMIAGHLSADNFWAHAGLRAAARLARLIDNPAQAAQFDEQAGKLADAYRSAAARRLTEIGELPQAIDTPGGHTWGSLWASYPDGPYEPNDPAVTRTLSAVRSRMREGLPIWWGSMHHYMGFRIWQTELMLGRQQDVIDGLYAALSHTTASNGGFEMGVRPNANRSNPENLTPHGWFSAEYIALVRNMLVRELADSNTVELGAALPDRWLTGKGVQVLNAPVSHGTVSWALKPDRHGATLSWNAPAHTRLRFRVPTQARQLKASAPVNDVTAQEAAMQQRPGESHRVIWLAGRRGSLRLRYSVRPTGQTYREAVIALCRSYRTSKFPIAGCSPDMFRPTQ